MVILKRSGAKRMTFKRREALYGFLFISPFLIGTVLLFAFPIYRSFHLSFSQIVNVTTYKLKSVGLLNYRKALFEDTSFVPMFLNITKTTLINTPLINIFAIFVAILLNRKMKGRAVFRAIIFLPVMLGSGFIMQQLLGQNVDKNAMEMARGILLPEQVRLSLGPAVVSAVEVFLNSITLIMWKSGVQILIYLAGLQGISVSLYEAARVDSATSWEMFWLITLPMLSPMILLNMIYTIIDSFTDSSSALVNYILDMGFTRGNFELSAAFSWIYFGFILLLIGVVFLLLWRFVKKVSEV